MIGACFVAKEKGRNRIHLFNADDSELQKHQSEVQWLQVLRHALEQDGLTVGQAALVAGYNSAANFATAYRKRFGMPPKLARARI